MKKQLLSLLFILPAFISKGDEQSSVLLKQFTDRFKGYSSYIIDFEVVAGDRPSAETGRLTAKGDKFFLEVYGFNVFYDGKTQHTYSQKLNEVTIEDVNMEGSMGFLFNPTRLFSEHEKDFNHVYKGSVAVGNKTLERIELTPKNRNLGFDRVELYLDRNTGDPYRIIFESNGEVEVKTTIKKITPNAAVSDQRFVFDKKKYPGVEVIDFR